MVQLLKFFLIIIFMVVLCGTAAPILFLWFVSRDVSTGSPFFNLTIIPISLSLFPFLVGIHSWKFFRSMGGEKSGVLVRASCLQLLPFWRGRGSSSRNALFCFVLQILFLLLEGEGMGEDLSYLESISGALCLLFFSTLFSLPRDRSAKRERSRRRRRRRRKGKGHRLCEGNEQGLNDKMRCPGHPHMERRVLGFLSSGGACLGGLPPEIGLEALALARSRLLMAVGHDYYKKVNMKIPIEHAGVVIFMLGALLSNTNQIEFTQRLPLGSELHMGQERCCFRGLDRLHGPTSHSICGNFIFYKQSWKNGEFMFEHVDRADQLPIHYFPRINKNQNFWFTMFPEKRYFFSIRERTHTSEVAIHTNLLSDLYALIGAGSSTTDGGYTTIMKLPLIFCIWMGFMLASLGGLRSLLRQLKKYPSHWN